MSHLSPQNEQFIAQAIAAGDYPNREAVIDKALETLRRYEEAEAEVLQEVAFGVKQADAGQARELADDDWAQLLSRALARADAERSRNG